MHSHTKQFLGLPIESTTKRSSSSSLVSSIWCAAMNKYPFL